MLWCIVQREYCQWLMDILATQTVYQFSLSQNIMITNKQIGKWATEPGNQGSHTSFTCYNSISMACNKLWKQCNKGDVQDKGTTIYGEPPPLLGIAKLWSILIREWESSITAPKPHSPLRVSKKKPLSYLKRLVCKRNLGLINVRLRLSFWPHMLLQGSKFIFDFFSAPPPRSLMVDP